ncbi:MAG: hypothetical protein K9N07_11730 [Candidatus Cloacimonetes bacterium]|nr:hypothetical protein [Candidatus Cloacimonadota bacterium]
MKALKSYSISHEIAINYFRECLEEGHPLSKSVLNSNDFSKGRFYTLLPDNANLSRINKLNEGGVLPVSQSVSILSHDNEWINSIDNDFVEYLIQKINSDKTLWSITEDRIKRLTDPNLDLLKTIGIVDSENNIYYSFNYANITKSVIQRILSEIPFWQFVSFLFDNTNLPINNPLSQYDIDRIVKRLKFIYLSAYDGESYIVWEKL